MGKNTIIKTIFHSKEGKLLIWAFLLFFIFIGILGYAFYTNFELGQTLSGAFIAHTFGGRAAGVGLCVALDINLYVTIAYNMFLEVLIVCFSYALFLLSFNHYLNIRYLNKFSLDMERKARKYKEVISRYGWIGVFTFVMIPLPITGPVVGSVIGYFLGFNLMRNFVCVFSGTLAAIVIWTVFFDFVSDHISKIQGVFAVIVIVVAVYFSKHIKDWFSANGIFRQKKKTE